MIDLCWNLVDDPDGEALRYRVFVDDTELTEGILGDEPGYPGPCVGPLNLVFERSYTWHVQAFEVDDPTRTSPQSATWSFTTMRDGVSQTVFADNFDEDLGWQVSGDASKGAWIRGKPIRTKDGELLAQPGACLGGAQCYFTGQNEGAVPDQADVAGGTTILTSPAFDLGGAAAATVQLGRFFYKSDAGPGPRLAVDLLVPQLNKPNEYDAYPLELLATATAGAPENLWRPREYPVCGPPLRDGSRLRISATDAGVGLLEAAIDSVVVRSHDDAVVCGAGEGSACDPEAGPSCPGELLCCSQGVTNDGIYRCSAPVPGLDFADPPPTADAPGNGPAGCDAPDLIVDAKWIDPIFTVIEVKNDTCELWEGCVGGLGGRRLMLFTAATPNIGSTDLVMGIPANHPELFHYSACHDHYHFDEFARYELFAGDMLAATGHKQAFCMLDTVSWAWGNDLPKFDCVNQGISRGFSDFYDAGLPCQWIDITGIPAGDYTLRITLNRPRPDTALPVLNERDYGNNTVDTVVSIPAP
ncbi:MAG: hypothetical protein IPO88_11385 [Nannocystis sp.]|uniref:lysyl oxidase family protein n=1 Tax=Nannocystis sp. TaxID=1962667 RepID=UPI002423432C|nr:lysyl oxidase family protein [Nannocystis sp.]MBK9754089.1 hypothetical protein [Nannocystis sp.]